MRAILPSSLAMKVFLNRVGYCAREMGVSLARAMAPADNFCRAPHLRLPEADLKIRLLFYPRDRTLPTGPAMSVSCQERPSARSASQSLLSVNVEPQNGKTYPFFRSPWACQIDRQRLKDQL